MRYSNALRTRIQSAGSELAPNDWRGVAGLRRRRRFGLETLLPRLLPRSSTGHLTRCTRACEFTRLMCTKVFFIFHLVLPYLVLMEISDFNLPTPLMCVDHPGQFAHIFLIIDAFALDIALALALKRLKFIRNLTSNYIIFSFNYLQFISYL